MVNVAQQIENVTEIELRPELNGYVKHIYTKINGIKIKETSYLKKMNEDDDQYKLICSFRFVGQYNIFSNKVHVIYDRETGFIARHSYTNNTLDIIFEIRYEDNVITKKIYRNGFRTFHPNGNTKFEEIQHPINMIKTNEYDEEGILIRSSNDSNWSLPDHDLYDFVNDCEYQEA
jgi:hypothetical protein